MLLAENIPDLNDSMKRPTKSFVVEVKRSARKTSGPAVAPAWVAAALRPLSAEAAPRSSQADASAIFRNNSIAAPAADAPSDPPWTGARILPVVVMDVGAILDTGRIPDPREWPHHVSEADERKRSLRKKRTREIVATSTVLPASVRVDAVPTKVDRVPADVPALPLASSFAPRVRGRSSEQESTLPRGERWKRRLPKVLR